MRREQVPFFFFFNDTATTEIYTLSLHDALPISHFHVVGLGGKQQEGFVLRLPPETSDGAVVGAAVYVAAQDRVRVAGNAERSLQGRIGLQVGEDGRIRDRFDQAGSKKRRRYSEDDVGIPALASERIYRRQEVKLTDIAAGGVLPTGDDEQRVNIAVGNAVTFLEARFTDRAIRRDEPWHGVLGPIERRDGDQRVLRRARSAPIGLRVAREALVGVGARPEPVVRVSLDRLDFAKPGLTVLEENCFIRRETRQRSASARRARWPAGVNGTGFGLTRTGRR